MNHDEEQRPPSIGFYFTEDFLAAVGRVMVHYAFVNSLVESLVDELLEVPKGKRGIVGADASFGAQLDLLNALYRTDDRQPILLKDFEKLVGRVRSNSGRRNDLVHSVVLPLGGDGPAIKLRRSVRKKSGISVVANPLELADVQRISDDLVKDWGSLTMLMDALVKARKGESLFEDEEEEEEEEEERPENQP